MRKILEGVSLFRRLAYPKHQELFARLARNQSPQALFITCSDSRVVPNLIVQADPGDLFIVRNVGNIVPPAGQSIGGTAASIEYAIEALGIRDVIVCGHSNCGAMKGVLHPEAVAAMPAVAAWVQHGAAARAAVDRLHPDADDDERLERMVEQNVIAQVRNLMTHAFVRRLVGADELEVYGWVYDIASGAIRGLDPSGTSFSPIEGNEKGSPDEQAILAALDTDEGAWGRV